MKTIIKKAYQMRAKISLVTLLSFSLFFGVLPLSACGCGVMILPSNSGWSYGKDAAEQSYIHYENGVEKLIIGLDIQHRDTGAVLVIPVPAKAGMVKADVLDVSPQFNGYDVADEVRENLSNIGKGLAATQIYPIIPIFLQSFSLGVGVGGAVPIPGAVAGDVRGSYGVTVYQHLEKNGMIAEVLSAETSDALYNYLTQKGLTVQKDSIPVFREYIKKDFSFTVAWINPSDVNGTARGVMMTFPTKEMYYPLKPGSAYAGDGTTKTITIVGHVTPKIYKDIKAVTEVRYFYTEGFTGEYGTYPEEFFKPSQNFGFTKITMSPKPSQLTQDLYISTWTPLRIINAQLINLHTFVYGLLLLVLVAFIATYLTLAVRNSSFKVENNFSKLVVCNCFTLIGTIVGSRIYLTENRFKYVFFFSVFFLLVTFGVIYLLMSIYPPAQLSWSTSFPTMPIIPIL